MFGLLARDEPRTLPLFPLRTVLYPGGVLPIKIFEQRYIEMVKQSLKRDEPFGVCLLTGGEEVAKAGVTQQFAMIGTLARIVRFDMPQQGILHIAAQGGERFRVTHHHVDASGLAVAEATLLAPEPALALGDDYAPLANLLELIAGRIGADNFPAEHAYDNGSWVGYRLAEVLPLPLHIKQTMLEINDAGVRLKVLREFLLQQQLI
jgi:Lon protease-like protein